MMLPSEQTDAASEPDPLTLLSALVKAHEVRFGEPGERQPILCIKTMGGLFLQHRALTEIPPHDEALIDELHGAGLISLNYHSTGSFDVVPTAEARRVVAVYERSLSEEPTADTAALLDAIIHQGDAANKLAWPAVRPVLAALRDYWMESGFSTDGIQIRPLVAACPSEQRPMFRATIASLIGGGYLQAASSISIDGFPAEIALTDRARAVLDGWPGAEPKDLAENLLAVLAEQAEQEEDPTRKRRLAQFAETVREVGTTITSEVLAKVITGGM